MINLNDLTFEQLQKAIEEAGEPKFRAKQIFSWFALGVTDIDLMTNISKTTKEKL